MPETTKTRNKAIYSLIIFCIIGFSLVLFSQIFYPYIEAIAPVWALFLIFYVSVAFLWLAFFSVFWGLDKRNLKASISFTYIIAAFDLFYQPYAVSLDGTLTSGGNVGKSSIDYFFGFYLNAIGITGIFLAIMVYFVVPMIMLIIYYLLVNPVKFLKSLRQGAA